MKRSRRHSVPSSTVSSSATLEAIVMSILLMLLVAVPTSDGALPFALQSDDGDAASSYAAGMYYDPKIERLYVTGSSYGSFFDPSFPYDTKIGDRDCFLGVLQLPKAVDPRGPLWLRRKSFGDPKSLDSCTSIYVRNRKGYRNFYMVGHSLAHPVMLEDIFQEGSEEEGDNVSVYGVVLDIDYAAQLQGGHLLQTSNVEYPTAIIGAEGDDDDDDDKDNNGQQKDLFAVTVHSDANFRGSSYEKWLMDQLTLQPDPDVFGSFLPPWLGTNYSATLLRLRPVEVTVQTSDSGAAATNTKVTWTPRWSKGLGALSGAGTQVTSLLQQPSSGDVLVAGFTTSVMATSNNEEEGQQSKPVIDGFIASVHPKSGETLGSVSLASVTNCSVQVFGICAPGGGSSSGNSSSSDVFVTGFSPVQGREGSYKTILLRLKPRTFDLVWSAEISGFAYDDDSENTVVYGFSCAVTSDSELVYVAGTVKNGASLSLDDGVTASTVSRGKDDVYVAQFKVSDGSPKYVRQYGTNEDDTLARGDSLVCDKFGNAILLVNTKGSFFREKKRISEGITTDVAVFSVSRETGTIISLDDDSDSHIPEEAKEKKSEGNNLEKEVIVETDLVQYHTGSPTFTNYFNRTGAPTATPKVGSSADPLATQTQTPPDSAPKAYKSASSDLFLLIAIVLLVCIIVASITMICCLQRSKRKKEYAIKEILFDAENYENSTSRDAIYVDGGLLKENDEKYRSGGNHDERSFASGTTIRPLPGHRNAIYEDTLLRLEPTVESFHCDLLHQKSEEPSLDSKMSAHQDDKVICNRNTDGSTLESRNVGHFDITELVYRDRMKTLSDLGSFSFDVEKERHRDAEDLISTLMQSYSENGLRDKQRRRSKRDYDIS